jgi:hypothetical protein
MDNSNKLHLVLSMMSKQFESLTLLLSNLIQTKYTNFMSYFRLIQSG